MNRIDGEIGSKELYGGDADLNSPTEFLMDTIDG